MTYCRQNISSNKQSSSHLRLRSEGGPPPDLLNVIYTPSMTHSDNVADRMNIVIIIVRGEQRESADSGLW